MAKREVPWPKSMLILPEGRSVDAVPSSVPSYPEEMDNIFFFSIVTDNVILIIESTKTLIFLPITITLC